MAQIIGLICVSLFFVFGINIIKIYFDIKINEKITLAFFIMLCAAVCEFIYKSVDAGKMFDGTLLAYAVETSSDAYNFICGSVGRFLYGKTDILKLIIGTCCLGIVFAGFENALFYPFIFLCFSDGGAVLLFTVLAMKYSDKLKISLIFAACAVLLDFRAAIVLVYIISKHTEMKKYSMYFYGAAALICGGIFGGKVLFAPAYAYALGKINDKYVCAVVKAASLILMGYSLISAF